VVILSFSLSSLLRLASHEAIRDEAGLGGGGIDIADRGGLSRRLPAQVLLYDKGRTLRT
jgi:hypothetical protein